MITQSSRRPDSWTGKTMSVLRANRLEACEKDLADLPFRCLFDGDCTDADAEVFYHLSYFPQEDRRNGSLVLHTLEQLRVRVLSSFAAELALLSPEEHDLLVRLVLFGGRLSLQDWEEVLPARGLVRRLWCRTREEDGTRCLYMPRQLCASALLLLAADAHKKVRDAVETVWEGIDDSLYLAGMVQASGPLLHLQSLLKGTHAANRPDLITRMFLSGCSTVYDAAGHLMLVHPGLADPAAMLLRLPFGSGACPEPDPETLQAASASLDDLENPLYEQMLFSIQDAVRPEISPEDAVEDLIILVKQDVPFADLSEVLSSMLVSVPTPEMLKALQALSARIPRWVWFSSSRLQ